MLAAYLAGLLLTGLLSAQEGDAARVEMPPESSELDPAVSAVILHASEQVRARPDDAAARATLGLVYEANLLWAEAAHSFEQALASGEDNPLWRLHLAIALEQQGRTQEALEVLEALTSRHSNLPAAMQRLGYLRLEHGDLEAARRAFDGLIDLAPNRAAGFIGAGEVALQSGEPETAVELLTRALSLEPGQRSANYQLGMAYRSLGRLDEAKRELARGLGAETAWLEDDLTSEAKRYSVHVTAQVDRAAAFLASNRPAEAADLLEELIERYPDNITVTNNLAIAYLRLGRLAEARALLDHALELDDRRFTTYLNLSSWATRSAQPEAAHRFALAARERAPGVAATHLAVARTLMQAVPPGTPPPIETLELARQSLQSAIAVGGDDPGAYLQLARLSARLDRLPEAYRTLERAAERWPDFWPAQLQRAWLLAEEDRLDEAAAVLAELPPTLDEHPEVQRLISRIDQKRSAREGEQ